MESRIQLPFNSVLDGSYRIERLGGSGGFGITYAAEDMKPRHHRRLKEYYPAEFGDRDRAMSVRPEIRAPQETFEWGRAASSRRRARWRASGIRASCACRACSRPTRPPTW